MKRGQNLDRLLEVANSVRARFGESKLKVLPKGHRVSPESCLVARAINFKCSAHTNTGEGDGRGCVVVYRRDVAEYLAAELGTTHETLHAPTRYKVPLGDDLYDIPRAFDKGELPVEVYRAAERPSTVLA